MEKFRMMIIAELQKLLGEDYELEAVETRKNNNTVLSGIRITKHGDKVSPVVYVDGYFEQCQKTGMTPHMVADKIAEQLHDNEEIAEFASKLTNYEFVKDMLSVALVNYDANREMLQDRPHHSFLDLAVVYYINARVNDEIKGSINVTYDWLSKWHIDERTLAEQSFKNLLHANMNFVTDLCGMAHIVSMEDMDEDLCELWEEIKEDALGSSYIFSNEDHHYGASILLNTPLLDRFATDHNANLIIYPSSVHEIIVAFENDERRKNLSSKDIMYINEHSVLREECLSNSVYIYDREKKEVRIHEMGAPLIKSMVEESVEC